MIRLLTENGPECWDETGQPIYWNCPEVWDRSGYFPTPPPSTTTAPAPTTTTTVVTRDCWDLDGRWTVPASEACEELVNPSTTTTVPATTTSTVVDRPADASQTVTTSTLSPGPLPLPEPPATTVVTVLPEFITQVVVSETPTVIERAETTATVPVHIVAQPVDQHGTLPITGAELVLVPVAIVCIALGRLLQRVVRR